MIDDKLMESKAKQKMDVSKIITRG